MATTGLDLCKTAAKSLNILAAGETLPSDDAVDILAALNRLIDEWNAERAAIFAVVWTNRVLTIALSPHTIGTSGTYIVTQRPVSVDGADYVQTTSTPNAYLPITIRDKAWWQANRVPGLTSSIQTDLYYDPTWPNGSLYFWPVPTAASTVRLQTRTLLSTYLLTTDFSLPPGYEQALTLTLAEAIAPLFQATIPASLTAMAAKARARIFANNSVPQRLRTQDAGMPSSGGRGSRSSWNYLTGE